MKSTKKLHTFLYSAILLLCMATTSCSDEKLAFPDYTISGEDVKVSFSLTFPSMEKMTRSNLPEADLNRVNNVWIRTYSSETKEATSAWVKNEKLNKTTTEFVDEKITIQTKSGYSYIVAVANVDENKGVLKNDPTAEPQALSSLLEKADSWDDFMNIAVVSPSDFNSTLAPSVPLPMSGCYIPGLLPGGSHPDNLGQFGAYNFKPVFIPATSQGSNTTNVEIPGGGSIHLRRLVSHLTFKFTPAKDLDLDVTSYRLVNIPRFSWLYERPDKETEETNFGDLATPESIKTFYSNDIHEFTGQYITKNTDGTSDFDFWQSENKHTGTSTTYAERGKYTTSGNDMLFTSLTGDTWTSANLASYILVSCSIKYKDQIKVDGDGAVKGKDEEGENVYRTGFATYLIHLGYISGNGLTEADKSKDFNCYRNVDYTYNIKVNGVNDIRLDAYAQGDFPNQEGIVIDQGTKLIELDAHYGILNIELTQKELEDKNFGFIIETYYGADYYKFTETSDLNGIDENLYNWIELRAAPDKYTLAYYKPRFGTNTNPDDQNSEVNGKKTFMLADLRSKDTNRGPFQDMQSEWISESGWYTVFVNEYTYEQIYNPDNVDYGDETQDGNDRWMHYVNRNPRRFFITTKKQEAADGKTIYARSKCGVEQMSIQTYYSSLTPTEEETYTENGTTYTIQAGTAVGAERVNETEGLNMRDTYGGGSDPNNGRWNVAQYLSGQPRSATDLNINHTGSRTNWKTYIQQTKLMTRGAVTGDRAQNGPVLPARGDDNPIYIPALTMLTGQTAAFNDPQDSSEAIEAINACTSRNRDNNGNGIIDPEELRWYVPAIGKYLRLILGRNSLGETPLMKYTSINNLPKVTITNKPDYTKGYWNTNGDIDNGAYTRYFFAGSNNFSGDKIQVVWGMEGMSTSAWGEWSGSPWQVRCLRNLGTDLRSVSKGHKVSMAYKRRPGTNIIEMAYYDASSIRKYKLAGNGDGSGQMPIHINTDNQYNMAYKAFEFKVSTDDDIQVVGANLTSTPNFIKTNPCSKYGNEWRVPNQFELAIMRNLGIFPTNSNDYKYWTSCTALYFNSNTGIGSPKYESEYQELFGVNKDKGVRLTAQNYGYATNPGIWIRCVRDVD